MLCILAFEIILALKSSCCNPTLTTSTEPLKNWQMDAQTGANYLTSQLCTTKHKRTQSG
jgi:hypothetical protein